MVQADIVDASSSVNGDSNDRACGPDNTGLDKAEPGILEQDDLKQGNSYNAGEPEASSFDGEDGMVSLGNASPPPSCTWKTVVTLEVSHDRPLDNLVSAP